MAPSACLLANASNYVCTPKAVPHPVRKEQTWAWTAAARDLCAELEASLSCQSEPYHDTWGCPDFDFDAFDEDEEVDFE